MADTPQQDRDIGLPRTRSGQRFVTKYSPDLALQICERIAQGDTLGEICREKDKFPHRTTFNRWCTQYPELARAYHAARELSAYSLEDEAIELVRQLMAEPGNAQKVRSVDIAVKQLQWSAEKRNRQAFGHQAQTSVVVPIQINTSLDLGEQEGQGTVDHPDIYTIEAEVDVDVEEVDKPLDTHNTGVPRRKPTKQSVKQKVDRRRKRVLTPPSEKMAERRRRDKGKQKEILDEAKKGMGAKKNA